MKKLSKTMMILIGCLVLYSQTLAATSDWQELGGGKARMLVSKNPDTNEITGVVEVKLDQGWKTYWRSPGGSGIAPEFDFSGSKAFSLSRIDFPVPEWIVLDGAAFFGYRDQASFVFTGTAEEFSTELNLELLIGVCEEICIPATASFTISAAKLSTSDPQIPVRLELSKSKLPKKPDDLSDIPLFEIVSDRIIAKLPANDPKETVRLVIWKKDGWISDPVKFGESADGKNLAIFNIPKGLAAGRGLKDWSYSLIRQSGDKQTVTNAIEGEFTPGTSH